jgi:hypothetical protein
MRFTVVGSGSEQLDLRKRLNRFANEQWLRAHVTHEEGVGIVLDQFKRTVGQTITVMDVRVGFGEYHPFQRWFKHERVASQPGQRAHRTATPVGNKACHAACYEMAIASQKP